jgi:7-cyano-7-deazaguanine synthase
MTDEAPEETKLRHKEASGVACVLLSGGLDSTACLHWALDKYREVRALGFDYGQPHRNAELVAAERIAGRNGVPFETIALADTLHSGLLAAVPVHDDKPRALHQAFIPGRNLVFLSVALSRACRWWPAEPQLSLVIGACLEDTSGFPDCTLGFLNAAEVSLSLAVNQQVRVTAPYCQTRKEDLVKSVLLAFPDGVDDLLSSWSCYAGKGPCGICTPCVLRADAFKKHGLTDRAVSPKMTGGDVSRDLRLAT